MQPPLEPKIYRIEPLDRLESILAHGFIWSDVIASALGLQGTQIGLDNIKQRRRKRFLQSHPDVTVGQCVPFYFAPRSVMLLTLHSGRNPELPHRGGQEPIIHLEADVRRTVAWAAEIERRWAFTTSNASKFSAIDYNDLRDLDKIQWDVIHATQWKSKGDVKMAEFLVDESFPWRLVQRIGVFGPDIAQVVTSTISGEIHVPVVQTLRDWYYGP